MYFRSQRKCAQDVSLSDYIETGSDGAALSLMDVVAEDCDLLEQVANRELGLQVRQAVADCLTLILAIPILRTVQRKIDAAEALLATQSAEQ